MRDAAIARLRQCVAGDPHDRYGARLALAALNTLGLLPVLAFHPLGGVERQAPLAAVLNDASTLLLTVAMAAMGLEVNLRSLLRTGVPALATGAIASAAQIVLTFGLIHWLM